MPVKPPFIFKEQARLFLIITTSNSMVDARGDPTSNEHLRHRERSDAISLSFEPILNVLCVGQVPLLNLTSQMLAHRT